MQGLALLHEARNGAQGHGAGFPCLSPSCLAGPSLSLCLPLAGCAWRRGEACPHPGHEGDASVGLGPPLALEASLPHGPGMRGHLQREGTHLQLPHGCWPMVGGGVVSPPHSLPQRQPFHWTWREAQSRSLTARHGARPAACHAAWQR